LAARRNRQRLDETALPKSIDKRRGEIGPSPDDTISQCIVLRSKVRRIRRLHSVDQPVNHD
jgi:hypothetical protein